MICLLAYESKENIYDLYPKREFLLNILILFCRLIYSKISYTFLQLQLAFVPAAVGFFHPLELELNLGFDLSLRSFASQINADRNLCQSKGLKFVIHQFLMYNKYTCFVLSLL